MTILAHRRRIWIRCAAVIAVVAFVISGVKLSAAQRRKSRHVRRTTVHRKHYRHRHYYRHYRRYHHYARIHLAPGRVRQIQEALVKAGYFHEKPDGVWGPSTRQAMKGFQEANGFSPTGLPEAKPLMKLGLGPHPLPPGLEPSPQGNAKTPDATETDTTASDSGPQDPSSSTARQ